MNKGKKLNAAATVAPLADALSKPLVGTPDANTLRAAVALLGPDNGGDKAKQASSETTGSSTETTVEKDTEEDENGSKETTTTTTTESTYSSSEPDEEESDDDSEEETDGEEETDASATATSTAARASSPPTRLTSGDVLALVRDLTGTAKPAEQLGALRAMSDNAKRAAKAEKSAAASKRTAKVDGAIRAGKLAPAQRSWALSVDPSVLDGYLKTSAPLVRRSATSSAKEAEASGELGQPSAAALAVAASMGMDPKALEAHAAELRKSGVLH